MSVTYYSTYDGHSIVTLYCDTCNSTLAFSDIDVELSRRDASDNGWMTEVTLNGYYDFCSPKCRLDYSVPSPKLPRMK